MKFFHRIEFLNEKFTLTSAALIVRTEGCLRFTHPEKQKAKKCALRGI